MLEPGEGLARKHHALQVAPVNGPERPPWALYQAISQETGYAASEVHEICKAKFGEPKVIEIGGQTVTQYTTHDKDVEWFGRFLDQVEAWAAQELGVVTG